MAMRFPTAPGHAARTLATALIAGLIGSLAAGLAAPARGADPDAPTTGRPAAANDAAWARATQPFARVQAAERAHMDQVIAAGPFAADWRALRAYRVPAWYGAAKFGIFIHWGVFSVPAFGSEWYPRLMYAPGTPEYNHHRKTYGPQDVFGYKDFIPLFQAKNYDPAAWAALFRASGARYVVPVAEHHDGFALYPSAMTAWNAMAMGPHRDLIGDLARAVRAQGMRFGLSSHLAEHDWFFETGRAIRSDVNDPRFAALYGPAQPRVMLSRQDIDVGADYTAVSQDWIDTWLARSGELVDLYHPDLIYFDWWIAKGEFRTQLTRFLAYYDDVMIRRAPGDAGVVNYKSGAFPDVAGVPDIERGARDAIAPTPWQTCTSVSRGSWGYVEGDSYKPTGELLRVLADVVSKNGNLLLNIGPRADGTIPGPARATLLGMGRWLRRNAEAIYASHPWRVFAEGPTRAVGGSFGERAVPRYMAADFRFTTAGRRIYAIAMGAHLPKTLTLRSIGPRDRVTRVRLLGGDTLTFTRDAAGLHIHGPAAWPDLPVIAIET